MVSPNYALPAVIIVIVVMSPAFSEPRGHPWCLKSGVFLLHWPRGLSLAKSPSAVAQDKTEPWEVPAPAGPCSQGFVCGSLNERPMTQDKIGNLLGLATADFWSTRKMSLVIYLTVSRISQRERDE